MTFTSDNREKKKRRKKKKEMWVKKYPEYKYF